MPAKKESAPKHSPLPWRTDGEGMLFDVHGSYIFQLDQTGTEFNADAALIVRAVNAHEALYMQLKSMAWAFHGNGRHGGDFSKCDSAVCDENRSALALARKEG